MKRSQAFLLAALIVPAAITLGTAASTIKEFPKGGVSFDNMQNFFERISGPTHLVREETVAIDPHLVIDAAAAELNVTFDETLTNQAHLKVETKGATTADIEITPTRLAFKPVTDSTLRITLSLPVSFAALDVKLQAGKCDLEGKKVTIAGLFQLQTEASACDIQFESLQSQSTKISLQAGKISLDTDVMQTESITATTEAGTLDWDMRLLKITDQNNPAISVTTAAGNSRFTIEEGDAFTLKTRVNMGSLTVSRDGSSETISGMDQERTFAGAAKAPLVTFEVNQGKGEFSVGKTR